MLNYTLARWITFSSFSLLMKIWPIKVPGRDKQPLDGMGGARKKTGMERVWRGGGGDKGSNPQARLETRLEIFVYFLQIYTCLILLYIYMGKVGGYVSSQNSNKNMFTIYILLHREKRKIGQPVHKITEEWLCFEDYPSCDLSLRGQNSKNVFNNRGSRWRIVQHL